MQMPPSCEPTIIARSGARFASFGPYVAAIDDGGRVRFQASLEGGHSGVFAGDGDGVDTLASSEGGAFASAISHPDASSDGAVTFFARCAPDLSAAMLVDQQGFRPLSDSGSGVSQAGPLGPTMNRRGTVAFRGLDTSGRSSVFAGSVGSVFRVAAVGDDFAQFHGLPIAAEDESIVFRADRADGREGIYRSRDGDINAVAECDGISRRFGSFPCVSDDGTVAVTATDADGTHSLVAFRDGAATTLLSCDDRFASFRGVLIAGEQTVFYGTPRGGELGIYRAHHEQGETCLAEIGTPMENSTVVELALNPVSINRSGQIALRLRLADDTELIVRLEADRQGVSRNGYQRSGTG